MQSSFTVGEVITWVDTNNLDKEQRLFWSKLYQGPFEVIETCVDQHGWSNIKIQEVTPGPRGVDKSWWPPRWFRRLED